MAKSFHVEYSKNAAKAFSKMDSFDGCADPRRRGKGLTGNHGSEWRYRVGDYRIIAEIQDEKLIVLVLAIGHRSDVNIEIEGKFS